MKLLAETKPIIQVNQRELARYQLERLNTRFGIDCRLIWSNGRKHGIYRPAIGAIILGNKVINHQDALVHSFAHAYCHSLHLDNSHDSLEYLECLWQTVLFLYREPNSYCWYADCLSIYNFGTNRCRNWQIEQEERGNVH